MRLEVVEEQLGWIEVFPLGGKVLYFHTMSRKLLSRNGAVVLGDRID